MAQLAMTLGSYVRGELGVSTTRKRPVVDVLSESLPPTILLGSAALLLAYGVGLPLALLLVTLPPRWRRRVDRGLLVLAVVPRFWLGVMLVFLLHSLAGWFPATHATSPGGGDWGDRIRHLVLPALTLGLPAAFVVCRYQFVVMQRVLGDLHVRMARAVGSGGVRLMVRHVLRPSLSPAVALFALDLPVLVSGAIVVEVIFAWPGVGRLTADAVLGSDYPLALAAALLSGTVVLLGRLLAETLARVIDPRQAADADSGHR
jgi:peptide/nickel transport system permease protein